MVSRVALPVARFARRRAALTALPALLAASLCLGAFDDAPAKRRLPLVRVADSTSLLHDEDTRAGRSGFGLGTILLVADPETGAPIAYGWVALRWRSFETPIALARPLS